MSRTLSLSVAALLLVLPSALAHDHHGVTEINFGEPMDAIMWMHILIQIIAWGFIFPIGMVLGMTKSRWHVPLQSTGIALTVLGIIFGHTHKGRKFPYTAHGTMAKIITFQLIAQTVLGVYLKMHIHERSARPYVARVHGYLGKTFPIVGWTQMLLGVITTLGYCRGGDTGQCLAHYIMGSAFIGYACILIIMLQLGTKWLERRGQSQEYLDSWVIMLWGIVNTFTEHHDAWNKNWSHKDMQHTMMGVLWWAGGALGIYLSRNKKRTFIPALIIIMTGWAMSSHSQNLMISTKIHSLFGYSLMAAGLVRIIEICFVLHDGPADANHIRVLQYITPYLLTLGGTMFMSGTNEELVAVDNLGVDHVTYAMGVFSLSFIIFMHMSFLINLYSTSGQNATQANSDELGSKEEGATENGGGYVALPRASMGNGGVVEFDLDQAESYELDHHDSHESSRGRDDGSANATSGQTAGNTSYWSSPRI